MNYTEITLTKDTREEIRERLNSIVSRGMFAINFTNRDSIPKLLARNFKPGEVWKAGNVTSCEKTNDFMVEHYPDTPKETRLIEINHPDAPYPHDKPTDFCENDIFYFTKNTVRIRIHKKHKDKNILVRIIPMRVSLNSIHASKMYEDSQYIRCDRADQALSAYGGL